MRLYTFFQHANWKLEKKALFWWNNRVNTSATRHRKVFNTCLHAFVVGKFKLSLRLKSVVRRRRRKTRKQTSFFLFRDDKRLPVYFQHDDERWHAYAQSRRGGGTFRDIFLSTSRALRNVWLFRETRRILSAYAVVPSALYSDTLRGSSFVFENL